MGDFNAKIGQPISTEIMTVSHGYRNRNFGGERLFYFAYENNLAIINTFFKEKDKQRWTWRSTDSIAKNELDYSSDID